jgi:hypothetical protein
MQMVQTVQKVHRSLTHPASINVFSRCFPRSRPNTEGGGFLPDSPSSPYGDSMTLQSLMPSMTVAQRLRAVALLDAIRNLKDEVVLRNAELANIDALEPRLADLRSSMDPRLFTADHDMFLERGKK